ncbi:MAG: hypothetical protein FJ137_23020 [Deltaproteobacteria bacterium]|nr:hypothetical protein [Deltaproteobacteria bacterium]
MVPAPGSAEPLAIRLQTLLDEGASPEALALATAAGFAILDEDCSQLALAAAEQSGRFDAFVEVAEARIPRARDAAEVRRLALAAGRVARDTRRDDSRAAGLLYDAHRSDPEDVDVRFELTAVYARIPRLAAHALTGILQPLRRVPDDARIFALAAHLAEQQGTPDRAAAMRSVSALLRAQPLPAEEATPRGADERADAA